LTKLSKVYTKKKPARVVASEVEMGTETEQAEVIDAGARLGPYPIDRV